MTSDHPITRSPDHPILPAFSPLDAWMAIRAVLAQQLGDDEWEMWIRHLRVLFSAPRRVPYCAGILLTAPRNGRVIFGAQRHYPKLKSLARKLGYDLILSVAPDDRQREKLEEESGKSFQYLQSAPSEMWPDWGRR